MDGYLLVRFLIALHVYILCYSSFRLTELGQKERTTISCEQSKAELILGIYQDSGKTTPSQPLSSQHVSY